MIALRPLLAVAAAVATIGSAEAGLSEGRPVTPKDLSDKKICWNNGYWDLFAANGEHSWGFGASQQTPARHHYTWSVPESGVIHLGRADRPTGSYRQAEVLPDGRFHLYWYVLMSLDHDQDRWGQVCN
jgi:hypothetical protein